MRLLHIADVHLDAPFATRSGDVRDRLRSASRRALRNAFDLALAEGVDAVLIAGDLFDGERLSFETEGFLVEEFGRLGRDGIAVVYATGNHDPGRVGARGVSRPWPGNVTVVGDREPRRIAVGRDPREPVGWVTAAGHASPRETSDLSRTFPRPVRELPEVALLHTQVHGAVDSGEHHAYAPSELERLVRAGFHYWALGHVHRPQALADAPPVVYAGSLQGRTAAETGPRGGYLVDLSEPESPRLAFHELAPVRWEALRIDGLEETSTFEGLVRSLTAAWEEAREAEPAPTCEGWMVRIELGGACPLWKELRREEDRRHLSEEVATRIGALEVELRSDRVTPPIDVEAHRTRTDVLGEALRLMEGLRAGDAGLDGFDPGELAATERDPELDRAAYVRELLADADAELIALTLEPDALRSAVARWEAPARAPDGGVDGPGDRTTTEGPEGPPTEGPPVADDAGAADQGSLPLDGAG